MKSIGTFEAKTHLSQLIEQVEQGEEFVITRRGKAVARLVSATEAPAGGRTGSAAADIEKLRRRLKVGATQKEIRDWRSEGRR
jgi:prevent-host-death family protein